MENALATLGPDRPPIRYIKLGANNAWTKRAFGNNEIPFSYREVPHEMALRGDQNEIAAHMVGLGKSQGVATNVARQVCEFCGLGRDTVWITFADGRMWWARAEAEVIWIGESDDYGPWIRRTRDPWLDCNPFGGQRVEELSLPGTMASPA